ncbi:MAG: M23 family metallopeptidase [Chloroflexota bacterium]
MKKNTVVILCLLVFSLLSCTSSKTEIVTPAAQVLFSDNKAASDIIAITNNNGSNTDCPNTECIYSIGTPTRITPLRLNLPTPGEEIISGWRPPQYPVPLALGQFDHFYFARPIAADVVNWPVANYRYGGTELSPGITHTGVDIPAIAGTPVLASGPGTVVWAGWGLFSNTPDNIKDPYGIAVAIRHDFGYNGRPLFTVYAHMRSTNVAIGELINTGDQIGEVGDTGYTTGPHLHFEVRIDKDSYYNTRNPELWLAPPQGWGVLAGRVQNSDRDFSHNMTVSIRSIENNHEWNVITYGSSAVNPDEYFNENMVISDLPSGKYLIKISPNLTETKQTIISIYPGQITFFVFRPPEGFIKNNFSEYPTPAPIKAP